MSENLEVRDVEAVDSEAELVPLNSEELDAVSGGAFPFIQT